MRRRFPGSHLAYLVEPPAAPVVERNPHIDDVIVAPRAGGLNGLAAEAALIRRLRRQRFDLAIDFHGGPRASILTWLSGARERIGYDVAGRGWMYTRRVERPRALRARHSVVNQWDLLAVLDIDLPHPGVIPVEMPVDADVALAVQRRLAAAGAAADDRLIVLHVSAGNPFRRWPIASFAAVASDLVLGDRRHRVVVTSGPSEHDAANRVIDEARARLPEPERPRVLSCGEFSLVELRALVECAALYIGGDSGPLHIAATSRVPIVGLYGPTLPARSAPWRAEEWPTEAVQIEGLACRPCDQRTCEPGDFRCLGWIHPRQVVEAASRALARAKE